MHQESISTPAIQIGPGRSLLTATRMHVTASFFRTVVWTMTGDGKDFDDIVYVPTPGLGTGKARCAICRPQRGRTPDATKGRPLVMVFEGGGFILGQPEDGQAFCRRIADEVGAIVISVDYAKAPRHPYPHALLQLHTVLKWAFSSSATARGLTTDPSRVAFMGNSAGGNLAATLTLLTSFSAGPNKRFRDELPDEFKQKLQVLLYPSVNTGVPYGERWRRSEPKVQEMSLPITVAELMEDCYLPPYIEREHILIRPIVAETELLASLRPAPALVLTAGLDCLKQEAIEYAKLLAAAGVQVEIHDYLEAKHGFSHYKKGKDFRPDDVKDCWDRIVKALAMALKD